MRLKQILTDGLIFARDLTQMAGCNEKSHEPSGSIQCGEFHDYLSKY